MRIVIDGRMFSESGIGRYIRSLVDELKIIDKKNEYFILHLQKDYQTLTYYHNFHKVLADFSWYSISEQRKLPQVINKLKPDLVHFPHFNIPVFYKGKFIVTIHDLIHQHFQMRRATTHDPITYKIKQLGYKAVFKNAVTKSIRILVPSNYVKNLLIKEWKISADKIVVTYEAVNDKIFSIENIMGKDRVIQVMEKFNITPPYIFYVGNAHPHKNVEGLIKAFLLLKKQFYDLKLVLSGGDHYFWQKIKAEYTDIDIIFTGFVTDEELVALYKNARCFVMPSFEEGFGIPLLEAMGVDCPIVSSNAGSLKEIGGDAALYFDPHNIHDMVEKISDVMVNQKLRAELITEGKKRHKLFSWEKLAKKTLEVYSQCG